MAALPALALLVFFGAAFCGYLWGQEVGYADGRADGHEDGHAEGKAEGVALASAFLAECGTCDCGADCGPDDDALDACAAALARHDDA